MDSKKVTCVRPDKSVGMILNTAAGVEPVFPASIKLRKVRSKTDDQVVNEICRVEQVCFSIEKDNEVIGSYSMYMNKAIAISLLEMQQEKNDGRGVSCVRAIASYLERDMFDDAQSVAYNDFDKIRSYPDIMKLVVSVFPKVKEAYHIEVGDSNE